MMATSVQAGNDDGGVEQGPERALDPPSDDGREDAGRGGGHSTRRGLGWGRGVWRDVQTTLLAHWKAEMTNPNGKVRAARLPSVRLDGNACVRSRPSLLSSPRRCGWRADRRHQLLPLLRLHCSCRGE